MLALLSEAETKRIIKDNSKYYKNWRLTTAEVDKRVNQAKNNGIGTSRKFYRKHKRCWYCDLIHQLHSRVGRERRFGHTSRKQKT